MIYLVVFVFVYNYLHQRGCVIRGVCLFVSLLATSRKIELSDLQRNFTKDVPSDTEDIVKFWNWKLSAWIENRKTEKINLAAPFIIANLSPTPYCLQPMTSVSITH